MQLPFAKLLNKFEVLISFPFIKVEVLILLLPFYFTILVFFFFFLNCVWLICFKMLSSYYDLNVTKIWFLFLVDWFGSEEAV